jgi:catechol 2,3-dioxygenase-like lactoylglutathione lyase family enzyme
MLNSAQVIGFVPTKDFRAAKTFYAGKLGLRFVSRDAFALVFKSGGTTIRVVKVPDFDPALYTILGWQVRGIDKRVVALTKRGVTFVRYPWMEQDKLGIWNAPGGTRVAWFKDPDGNVLSLSSR